MRGGKRTTTLATPRAIDAQIPDERDEPRGNAAALGGVLRRAFVHDRTNALAAATAALAVGATVAGVRSALGSYATLPHRVALVGKAGGVCWYDDSKATNPDAARRAVASFDSVVLLAGGRILRRRTG